MGAAQASSTAGLLDALSLFSDIADDLVVSTVRDTHLAWSRRLRHRLAPHLGAVGTVAHSVHHGTAGAVYGVIGAGLRGGALALDLGARTGAGPRMEGRRSSRVMSTINGLIGDRLAEDRSRLALAMAVRHEGVDVPAERCALARAYPEAGSRVVVFVPGLCEDESAWDRDADRHLATYPTDVVAAGWTAVCVRANTGLAVSTNGALLDALLTDLTAAWPVPVERLVLVGHSMGGLIARAACARSGPWVPMVSDLVTLGSPHLGAPLAGWATRGSANLARLPETAAFARILEHRSAGILDLERGLDRATAPTPSHVRMRLVSGSLARLRFLGDLLVDPDSATGAAPDGDRLFPDADVVHVRGADHFDLLNHDDVRAALLGWLAQEQVASG